MIIELTLEGNTWIAEFYGVKSEKVKEVFGTTRVPTGFARTAKPQMVKAEMERRNPGYTVKLKGGSK